jgi:GTPase SAR1 family protein
MIVYAINDAQSFQDVTEWKHSLETYADANIQIILVGNKTDLERQRVISFDGGKLKAEEMGASFIEVSARAGFAIDDLFMQAARFAMEHDKAPATVIPVKLGSEKSCLC